MMDLNNKNCAMLYELARVRYDQEKASGLDDAEAIKTVVIVVAMAVNQGKITPALWGDSHHAEQNHSHRTSRR